MNGGGVLKFYMVGEFPLLRLKVKVKTQKQDFMIRLKCFYGLLLSALAVQCTNVLFSGLYEGERKLLQYNADNIGKYLLCSRG